jgi:hypothetical protein
MRRFVAGRAAAQLLDNNVVFTDQFAGIGCPDEESLLLAGLDMQNDLGLLASLVEKVG